MNGHAGSPILRGIASGLVCALVVCAILMAAYLILPGVLLPWTFFIALMLTLTLFFIFLKIPHQGDPELENMEISSPDRPIMPALTAGVNQEEQLQEIEQLRERIEKSRMGLKRISKDDQSGRMAAALHNLGAAYYDLAVKEKAALGRRADFNNLKQARSFLTKALEERDRGGAPELWAATVLALGQAQLMTGDWSGRPEFLEQAIDSFGSALEVFIADGDAEKQQQAQEGLARANELKESWEEYESRNDGDLL